MRFDYDYVIVGGGMAADAAARGIRQVDPDGSIAILGEEADPPYERPPLSKDLWRDPAGHEPFLGTDGATDAQLHLSTRVSAVDRSARTVTAADDDVVVVEAHALTVRAPRPVGASSGGSGSGGTFAPHPRVARGETVRA